MWISCTVSRMGKLVVASFLLGMLVTYVVML